MRPYRNLKISSLIERELSKILTRDFDFEGALVTITGVDVTSDLAKAKIKLSVFPEFKGPDCYFKLEKEQGNLQHQLLKIMNIKPMPRIEFMIDKEPASSL